jgi:hypothetical protein
MALATSYFSQTIYDSTMKPNGTPESTNWRVPVATLTAANLVAKTALIQALIDAVADLTLGNVGSNEVVQDRDIVSVAPAASQLAQRENKLLLRYSDGATLQKFSVSIGTFDLSALPLHSEFLDLTAGEGLALKTAFDAIVVNPTASANPVTLNSAQFVGRNT